MHKFYQLLRINHYIKNFLVFAPLLFTSGFSNNKDLFNSLYAFIVFCFSEGGLILFIETLLSVGFPIVSMKNISFAEEKQYFYTKLNNKPMFR